MKHIHPLALLVTVALVGSAAWADDAHHPKSAASAAKVPQTASAPNTAPGAAASSEAAKANAAKVDEQIKAMRELRDKMMSARTPDERSALMAQAMKSMQETMPMMGGMGMGMGMGMGGMAADDKDKMKGGMPDMMMRHQMMDKRMEMMETMMQMMMMDRVPAAPVK